MTFLYDFWFFFYNILRNWIVCVGIRRLIQTCMKNVVISRYQESRVWDASSSNLNNLFMPKANATNEQMKLFCNDDSHTFRHHELEHAGCTLLFAQMKSQEKQTVMMIIGGTTIPIHVQEKDRKENTQHRLCYQSHSVSSSKTLKQIMILKYFAYFACGTRSEMSKIWNNNCKLFVPRIPGFPFGMVRSQKTKHEMQRTTKHTIHTRWDRKRCAWQKQKKMNKKRGGAGKSATIIDINDVNFCSILRVFRFHRLPYSSSVLMNSYRYAAHNTPAHRTNKADNFTSLQLYHPNGIIAVECQR